MKRFVLLLIIFPFVLGGLQAQNNTAERVEDKIPVRWGEKFDVIFNRGALLNTSTPDAEIDPTRSGSYGIGLGFGIPIGKTFAFKIEPRGTWQKLYYRMDAENKVFPTSNSSSANAGDTAFVYEKQRAFYPELALGFKVNLVRNIDEQVRFYIELGAVAGYNTGSTQKFRYEIGASGEEIKTTVKSHRIPGLEPLRYGAYGRLGLSWIALYAYYHLSDFFEPNATEFRPSFNPLEIGFSVVF